MIKKKVLIIPSWYPNREQIAIGTFYREQAQILEEYFDIKILLGVANPISRWKILYSLLEFYVLQAKPVKWINNYLLSPPDAFCFAYNVNSLLSETTRFNFLVKSYINVFQQVIDQGFFPDIIHGQSALYGGIVASILGKKYKIPVLITEHQHLLFTIYNDFRFSQFKKALETANQVAVVSQHQKRMILMNNIKCEPIIVGNCVDDTKFNIKYDKILNDHFRILTIAYNSYIKDMKTCFKAISYLVNIGIKDFEITIINPSTSQEDLSIYQSYAQELGIFNFCRWINGVQLEKMPEHYQNCDVFVSTAIAETFGLSICEAMFCGKPVVATSNGGLDDMLTEKNGIKVDIGDYQAVADAILFIKKYPSQFSSEEIRKSVLDKFGIKAFTEKMVNLYFTTMNEYS